MEPLRSLGCELMPSEPVRTTNSTRWPVTTEHRKGASMIRHGTGSASWTWLSPDTMKQGRRGDVQSGAVTPINIIDRIFKKSIVFFIVGTRSRTDGKAHNWRLGDRSVCSSGPVMSAWRR